MCLWIHQVHHNTVLPEGKHLQIRVGWWDALLSSFRAWRCNHRKPGSVFLEVITNEDFCQIIGIVVLSACMLKDFQVFLLMSTFFGFHISAFTIEIHNRTVSMQVTEVCTSTIPKWSDWKLPSSTKHPLNRNGKPFLLSFNFRIMA